MRCDEDNKVFKEINSLYLPRDKSRTNKKSDPPRDMGERAGITDTTPRDADVGRLTPVAVYLHLLFVFLHHSRR